MAELWDMQAKSVVEVDDSEVPDALASGRYGVRDWDVNNNGRVSVVTPGGGYGTVPLTNLGVALDKGYRIAGDADKRRREDVRAAKTGSDIPVAGPLMAGLQGFGDIATFGALPQAMQALSEQQGLGEFYRTFRGTMEEEHPTATTIGKVAGAIVPGVIGGAAAAGAGTGLARAGLGSTGRAIAAGGVGGAVEGALYGGAELVSDQALGKSTDVAEDILAYVGGGALLGGTLGVALGATGVGLRAGAKKILGKADEVAKARSASLGEIAQNPESVATRLMRYPSEAAAKAAAVLQGKDVDTIKRFLDPGKAGRILRQRAQEGASSEFRTSTARRLVGQLDESAKSFDEISSEAMGAMKAENIQAVVRPSAKSADQAMEVMRQLRGEVDDILASKDVYTGTLALRYAKQADKYLRGMEREVNDTALRLATSRSVDDAAELFIKLDQTKRRIGKWSRPGGMLSGIDREGVGRFRTMYERMRTHLEDTNLYGGAADAQRAINEPWAKLLESEQFFRRKFTTRFGTAEWEPVFRADGGSVASFINKVGGPESDLAREALESHVAGQLRLADAIEGTFPIGSNASRAVESLRRTGRDMRNLLDGAYEKVELANQLADISTGGALVNAGKWSRVITAGEGVVKRAYQMSGFEKIELARKAATERVNKSVTKFLSEVPRRRLRPGVRPGAMAALFETSLSPRKERAPRSSIEAYRRQSRELADMVADPNALADRVASAVTDVEAFAPNVASALAAKSAQITSWLYDKLPRAPSASTLTPFADQWEPSKTQIATFARQFRAATDPLSVLDDMEDGTITQESVDAIRELYPSLYDKIVTKVAEVAGSRTEPLPHSDRVQFSILFGIPLDPMMVPGQLLALQQAVTSQPPSPTPQAQPPARGQAGGGTRVQGLGKLNLADSMKTRTQQIGESQS